MVQENTFVLLFDYLVSTRIGNIIFGFLGALLLYLIFKIVIKIIDYIVFRRLMRRVLKAVYGDNYDEDDDNYNTLPSSNQEDEQSQKKDKKRDMIREAERMQNMENEFMAGGTRHQRTQQKIVGMAQPLGKWTARVMRQWIEKHKHIDMNLVNDLGYFQALVIAERKAQGLDIGQTGNKQSGFSR